MVAADAIELDAHDMGSVELGVKFSSSAAGTVSAIKFYKSPGSHSAHSVSLWSSSGTRLAGPVASANETASGWQTVQLPTPVAINANTTYVASYHTTDYADNYPYPWPYGNAPLSAPTGAGVYQYSNSSTFPTQTRNNSNYWVDVVFNAGVTPPPPPPPVNGTCGAANGTTVATKPTSNLCAVGTASTVSGTGPWAWTCAGANGGSNASCSAQLQPPPPLAVNGACGSANGEQFVTAPTTNLCSTGSASTVSGSGPWTWSCSGLNGGSTAACTASLVPNPPPPPPPSGSILPPDRDASANWKMAGLQSIGGIPNRTTVCATVNPLGGGQNDATNINTAISNCPVEQVVQLAAGTFTIAEGSYIKLNKGVTLRGAGAGATLLTRTDGATVGSYFPGSNPTPMIMAGPAMYSLGSAGQSMLAADVANGSYSVTVANATGFAAGQVVVLDETSGASWQQDRVYNSEQIWASPDYRVVWEEVQSGRRQFRRRLRQQYLSLHLRQCWLLVRQL